MEKHYIWTLWIKMQFHAFWIKLSVTVWVKSYELSWFAAQLLGFQAKNMAKDGLDRFLVKNVPVFRTFSTEKRLSEDFRRSIFLTSLGCLTIILFTWRHIQNTNRRTCYQYGGAIEIIFRQKGMRARSEWSEYILIPWTPGPPHLILAHPHTHDIYTRLIL